MRSAPDSRTPDAEVWRSLTVSATKTELFAEDLYFRECWADALDVLGAPDDAPTAGRTVADALAPLGLLSFKCDGMAGRQAERTLRYLADNGFSIVASAPIRHNRHSMRELWRYNWHVYTTDRLALMTLMHGVSDSVLLIVRDDRYDATVPGAVRLSVLKGSADPEARGPEHLRTLLEPPNKIINFVHVADEPADVVREIGIFLDRTERRALLAEVGAADTEAAERRARAEVARLEGRTPASDFDLEAAFERVQPAVTPDALTRLRQAADSGMLLSWDELTALLDPASPKIEVWDFVRIATEVLDADRQASADLLPPSSAAEWQEAAALHGRSPSA
ncbi:nucleoside-diphosphate kinase [Streptomyces sp. CRN 30]|uniref:nucleoside-diphosphate kinase n=1 Tax=Streptomyces sp. CRN 30 TaxID=3075613 RepID=UPI002A7FAC28|nr:nucleoside-diphosphate kinase [Streptomyces sp. CRN 30]